VIKQFKAQASKMLRKEAEEETWGKRSTAI